GIKYKVQQGIFLSIALAIVVIIAGGLAIHPVLQMMDLEKEVRHIDKYYLISLGAGIVPLFVFNTLRAFMDALGKTRTSMFIILCSLTINILFNYIFIFGIFGVPAFGGIGLGIATAITYWLSCVFSIIVVLRM